MIYAFGDYQLDTDLYELRHAGRSVPLEPQVFDVLAYLVSNRDRVVTRTELLDEVWGDRFVSDSALSSRVKAARRIIGDDGGKQHSIRTVHGRGFRFVAETREAASPTRPTAGTGHAAGTRPLSQQVRFCRAPDGVRLAYAVAGDGPPLVKAANWLTHLRHDWESIVWGHWLRDLSACHRLVHYDERGSGMSDWQAEDLSFESWVRDLEAVVDEVGLDRFALLGISQGGAVAVDYAVKHPERVSHLILYGAFALGRTRRARTARERQEAEVMLDIVQAGWGEDTSALRRMFAAQFMPGGTPEHWDAFDAHQRLTATPENARRLLGTSSGVDITDLAPQVCTPTLVVHSVDDRRVPYEQGELLASLIPGSQFVPLQSSNHLLLDGEPAWTEFVVALEAFVA
jgi:pimeloyl-ACP methyl ester carboxylesterase/DNA-binding winged helix-turn-helix (wHTH) protein